MGRSGWVVGVVRSEGHCPEPRYDGDTSGYGRFVHVLFLLSLSLHSFLSSLFRISPLYQFSFIEVLYLSSTSFLNKRSRGLMSSYED